MSQINHERIYKIIGRDQAEAKFSVFPTYMLQIDFKGSLIKLRAPGDAIRFEPRTVLGISAVDVSYTADHAQSAFWIVTLSKDDADELWSTLAQVQQAVEDFNRKP